MCCLVLQSKCALLFTIQFAALVFFVFFRFFSATILSGPYLWNRYSQRLQIDCAAWSCGLILLLLTIQFSSLISSLINIIRLLLTTLEFFIFGGSLLGRIQGDREPVSFILVFVDASGHTALVNCISHILGLVTNQGGMEFLGLVVILKLCFSNSLFALTGKGGGEKVSELWKVSCSNFFFFFLQEKPKFSYLELSTLMRIQISKKVVGYHSLPLDFVEDDLNAPTPIHKFYYSRMNE